MRLLKISLLVLAACLILNQDMTAEADKETEENTMASSGFDPGRLRVGEEVSGAFVDPKSAVTPAPEEVKAIGYAYDETKLEYELVWADEFDADGAPDPEKWDYDVGGSGWGNNELQFYTREGNAWVENGLLVLEARAEERGGKKYTSARLVSRNKGDWLYGRFEVRAKLPRGLGTWPAVWMLPTDWAYGGWPASGEIDLMEHVGYDQGVTHASVHTQAYNHAIRTQKTATKRVPGISDDFHTFTLTWLPDRIAIAVDDTVYYSYEPAKYAAQPTWREWPFDRRFHLLLNIAFGGNWGGARGVDEGVLPQRMLVDYVRVYQSREITALAGGNPAAEE